ncbi:MAG: FAD-binding oxidoreductase [Patescibacteria group bacterium]
MINVYKTKLAYKMQLSPDVWLFGFDLPEDQKLEFVPGQYLIMKIPQPSGDPVNRMYSIASPSFQKQSFDIIAKLLKDGAASEYFRNLKIGDMVEFHGPAGIFTLKDNPSDKIFLATGTGIAPIRSMILSQFHNDNEVQHNYYMFWGVRTMQDVYFLDELHVLSQKYPKFHFYICLSQETNLDAVAEEDKKKFIIGRVHKGFSSILGFMYDYDFYICGAAEVVDSLKTYLAENNVPKTQIVSEKFV